MMPFFLILVTAVRDEDDLKRVVFGFLGAMAIYIAHSFREFLCGRHVYRMGIARMIGVDTTLGDPNSFAASMLLALALVPAVWGAYRSPWVHRFLIGYVGLSVLCILLTGSRSGLIGLLVWSAICVAQSRWRRKLPLLLLGGAPLIFFALPEDLQTRFETIVNPAAGPASAQLSADGRIEGFWTGIRLWQNNPLFGVGPGAWRRASGSPIESHNLYGQLLGEMGTAGIVTFGAILVGFAINFRRARDTYRRHPEWGQDFLYLLVRGVAVGVFLMLLMGCFGHNLFRYNWVWYAGFLIIAWRCLQDREAWGTYATDTDDETDWEPEPTEGYSDWRVAHRGPA
jgi:O-antigen ligase